MNRVWTTFVRVVQDRNLRVLLALSVLLGLAYSFVVPFMSHFGMHEVGMSSLGFGFFMTATALAGIAVSTLLARRSDINVSRRTTLLWGGVSGTSGYVAYALVREPLLLTLAGAVLLGISSVTFSQVFAYARDLLDRSATPPDDVPLTMNVVRLCFALSWTFGPAAAAWVMVTFSFVGLFLAAALLFALFTLVTLLFVPEIPPSDESRKAALAMPLGTALREPRLLTFFAAFVLYFACSTMGMMNMPLLITEELGGSTADVGIAYSVAPFFELPFMLYVGVLASRVAPARIIATALVLATVYYLGLSLVPAVAGLYLLQIASAAIVAVMSGLAITFFQGFLPAQTGSATNLYASATRFGSILGYLTFGAMVEQLGHRAVFSVCAGATGVSFLATLGALRRARHPAPAPLAGA